MITSKVILEDYIPTIKAGMESAANRAVRETLFEIESRSKAMMQGPKTGRVYVRGKTTHQASAPGEAPAVDTGNLWDSIQTKMIGQLSGIVYTNAEYAPSLEFGSVRMAARPFFGPATQEAWPVFLEKMRRITG